jgi:hypothetical protein
VSKTAQALDLVGGLFHYYSRRLYSRLPQPLNDIWLVFHSNPRNSQLAAIAITEIWVCCSKQGSKR